MHRAFCKRDHLLVMQPPLIDFTSRFDRLEPTQVLDGLVRALNRPGRGVFDWSRQCRFKQDKLVSRVVPSGCVMVVEAMGGTVACESTEGTGPGLRSACQKPSRAET